MLESFIKLGIIALISYIIGSFPTAYLISKKFFGFDIREKGSGNMGSTNAIRILGLKWGLAVQIIDISKGILAIIVASFLGKDIVLPTVVNMFQDITVVKAIAGTFAVIGHIWSVFVRFRGGKGINTAAGMLLAITPLDVGIALLIFIVAVILSGYISLGSITAALALPSSMFVRYNLLHNNIPGYDPVIYIIMLLTSILVYQHRKNISRLIKGTENKFSKLQLFKRKHYSS
jgi:glycerol-3-phosphate acyltransferase PlsY